MAKLLVTLTIVLSAPLFALADSFTVTTLAGDEFSINYDKKTLIKQGVKLNSGQLVNYAEITLIRTDIFDAYEKAVKRTSKNYADQIRL